MAYLAGAAAPSLRTSLHFLYQNPCALHKRQPEMGASHRRFRCSLTLAEGCAYFVRGRPGRFRPSSSFSVCFSSALTPELKSTLDKVVSSHKVVLFMKGSKDFPQCGFSRTVVQILMSLNVPFETMDILENEMLRQGLKEYSSWPTFPQLYIDGEFFGGCDITVEAYQSGELQELLEKATCS
ncbi:monothiol glutaredoxin-S7, chloroplastic [Phalaenopsis equestris]|uniref:monothiol glutaredoxin-S7, chloroplastic n=1 Tax=Phalaenopsis equestris TaxID=78828 RepID=UPI0009E61AA4|nr:monothiol glutaredoxin-S7, chloroplastic [Phalaenopsis equestris]